MNVWLDCGAYMPQKAHKQDAGYDIRAREGKVLYAGREAVFKTGVHIELDPGTAAVLISKSGLNVHHDITSTGLIDEGYTGEITVKLYNHGRKDYYVSAGDKISQLVIIPVLSPELVLTEGAEKESERGNNGFGSTGR